MSHCVGELHKVIRDLASAGLHGPLAMVHPDPGKPSLNAAHSGEVNCFEPSPVPFPAVVTTSCKGQSAH